MPRPMINPEQRIFTYGLWKEGNGPAAILRVLEQEFIETVSERTISTWIRGFKELNTESIDRDSPFEWHRMDRYQIPWEASRFLLNIHKQVLERDVGIFYKAPSPYEPMSKYQLPVTVRQVQWWYQVHRAVPEVGTLDVWQLAQRFVVQELLRDILAEPADFSGLEHHLMYQPWQGWPEDTSNWDAYQEAISTGRISPLPNEGIATEIGILGGKKTMEFLLGRSVNQECPELLWSQQSQITRNKIARSIKNKEDTDGEAQG